MDLAFLVGARSDSLSDNRIREKLLDMCPWFEPRYSHRNTWRECAEECVRRRNEHGEFAPELRLVGAEEFIERPILDTKEKTLDWNELDDGKYVSEHGIEVDLAFAKKEMEDQTHDQRHAQQPNPDSSYSDTNTTPLPWPTCDEAFDVGSLLLHSKVVSFPDVLVILLQDPFVRNRCEAIVKYRDSQGLKPDVSESFPVEQMPSVYVLGNHVFLVASRVNQNSSETVIMIPDRQDGGVITLHTLPQPTKHVCCYDGLFHFFNKGYYKSVQLNLHEYTVEKGSTSVKGLWNIDTVRNDLWDSRYMVITEEDEECFIVDVKRGVFVGAKLLEGCYQVDEEFKKREYGDSD